MTVYPDCARCINCGRPVTDGQALDMPDGPLCVACYEANEAGVESEDQVQEIAGD